MPISTSGRALEARIISEDLVAREPWNKANIDRFRRALVMLGEGDPDAIIADRLSGDSPFLATEKMDLNEGVASTPPASAGAETRPPTRPTGAKAAGAGRASRSTSPMRWPMPAASRRRCVPPPPRSLDQVFRGHARRRRPRSPSEEARRGSSTGSRSRITRWA